MDTERIFDNADLSEADKELTALSREVTIYLWSHEAWGIMLARQGIIKKKYAPEIFKVLLELEKLGVENESSGGHKAVEAYVVEKLGRAVAGNLSIGRTTVTPYMRMELRLPFLKFMGLVIELLGNLLVCADKFKDCIMPGYTHLAPAQPATFGHYLVSVHDPVARILEHMELSYRQLNMNELGCGALAGTSWPIDRDLSSELLGFNGCVENANDAVSGTDCFVSSASAVANLMSVLSRFSQDLNYWATNEFDFLDVPRVLMAKSHSYMMPQKTAKNNGDLEDLRIACADAIGYLVATVTNASRTSHSDMHEMIYIHRPVLEALKSSGEQVYRLGRNVTGIKVNRERMLEAARGGFSCATELANNIVRKYDVDYRTAHDILNAFVHMAISKKKDSGDVDSAMLDEASLECCGRELGVPDEMLRLSLDPQNFIESHKSPGGVNPDEVSRMIEDRKRKMKDLTAGHTARVKQLTGAREKLKAAVGEIARSSAD